MILVCHPRFLVIPDLIRLTTALAVIQSYFFGFTFVVNTLYFFLYFVLFVSFVVSSLFLILDL